MQKHTMRWDDLRVFLAVARQSRLLNAGRTLGLDPATVGRRMGALEQALGAKLFDRSPQGYALTEAGQQPAGARPGDGEPGERRGRGGRRARRPAVGHGADRRAGRGLELPADRRLRRAEPRQPRPAGAGGGAAAHVLAVASARRTSRSPSRRRPPGGSRCARSPTTGSGSTPAPTWWRRSGEVRGDGRPARGCAASATSRT